MRKVVKKRTNFKTVAKIFLITVCVFIVALLRVHLYVLIDNSKYEMGKKMDEEEKLVKQREKLNRQLYSLRSPSRIEEEAVRSGMSYPKLWQIRKIK